MNRDDLKFKLYELIEEIQEDYPAVTGVLLCLIGVIITQRETLLFKFIKPFTKSERDALLENQAKLN